MISPLSARIVDWIERFVKVGPVCALVVPLTTAESSV